MMMTLVDLRILKGYHDNTYVYKVTVVAQMGHFGNLNVGN